MKKLILFFVFSAMVFSSIAQKTAVVYASNDPYSSCAAAIADQKHSLNYVLDVNVSDSAAQYAWWATVTDSVTNAYVFVDTTLNYTANKFKGALYKSLRAKVKTGNSIKFYKGTTSLTISDQAWDSIYPGIVPPQIVMFLSEKYLTADRAVASGGNDSSIFKANATGWTNDQFNTGYMVYVTAGPNIGQAKDIVDTRAVTTGNADTLLMTGTGNKFTSAITSSSYFTIMKTTNYNKFAFYDMYAYYAVLSLIPDIQTYSKEWKQLLNNNNKLNSLATGRAPNQDKAYTDLLVSHGRNIYTYILKAATN